MVFYEAPHKLVNTLEDLCETFGGDRPVALCRELTKLHEETVRTTLSQAAERYRETPPKGEFVLVVAGAAPRKEEAVSLEEAAALVRRRREEGLKMKEAVREVADLTGVNKNELYAAALKG